VVVPCLKAPRAQVDTHPVERPRRQDGDDSGHDSGGRPPTTVSTVPQSAVRAGPTSSWVVISVDPEARARTAEGDLATLTGRTRDDLVGRRVVDCLHPDDADQAALLLGGTGPRHHPLRVTNRFVHPDGTEVWAESVLISRSTVDGDDELLVLEAVLDAGLDQPDDELATGFPFPAVEVVADLLVVAEARELLDR